MMTGKADLSQNATFLIIPVNKLIKLIFFKSIDGIHFLPSVEFQSKRRKYLEIPKKHKKTWILPLKIHQIDFDWARTHRIASNSRNCLEIHHIAPETIFFQIKYNF